MVESRLIEEKHSVKKFTCKLTVISITVFDFWWNDTGGMWECCSRKIKKQLESDALEDMRGTGFTDE